MKKEFIELSLDLVEENIDLREKIISTQKETIEAQKNALNLSMDLNKALSSMVLIATDVDELIPFETIDWLADMLVSDSHDDYSLLEQSSF